MAFNIIWLCVMIYFIIGNILAKKNLVAKFEFWIIVWTWLPLQIFLWVDTFIERWWPKIKFVLGIMAMVGCVFVVLFVAFICIILAEIDSRLHHP